MGARARAARRRDCNSRVLLAHLLSGQVCLLACSARSNGGKIDFASSTPLVRFVFSPAGKSFCRPAARKRPAGRPKAIGCPLARYKTKLAQPPEECLNRANSNSFSSSNFHVLRAKWTLVGAHRIGQTASEAHFRPRGQNSGESLSLARLQVCFLRGRRGRGLQRFGQFASDTSARRVATNRPLAHRPDASFLQTEALASN